MRARDACVQPPRLNLLQRLFLWLCWRPWILGRWWRAFEDEMYTRGWYHGFDTGQMWTRKTEGRKGS